MLSDVCKKGDKKLRIFHALKLIEKIYKVLREIYYFSDECSFLENDEGGREGEKEEEFIQVYRSIELIFTKSFKDEDLLKD